MTQKEEAQAYLEGLAEKEALKKQKAKEYREANKERLKEIRKRYRMRKELTE